MSINVKVGVAGGDGETFVDTRGVPGIEIKEVICLIDTRLVRETDV
jgi:hypothetical protein